jgi:hypothetical protein
MPHTDGHLQITRKIRTLETLQIELIHQVAEVVRGVHNGHPKEMAASMGTLMAMLYYIAYQADVPFEAIEQALIQALPKVLEPSELDPGALDHIRRHLSTKR